MEKNLQEGTRQNLADRSWWITQLGDVSIRKNSYFHFDVQKDSRTVDVIARTGVPARLVWTGLGPY